LEEAMAEEDLVPSSFLSWHLVIPMRGSPLDLERKRWRKKLL